MKTKQKPQSIYDFDLDTLLREPAEVLAEFLDVPPSTVKRWKSGTLTPPLMAVRLLAVRFECDLSAIWGKEWEGFHFGKDGLFYHPFWRKGFTAGEMKAMFFQIQTTWHQKREILSLKRRIDELESEIVQVNEQVWKYKRLVSLESRLGLMLERVAV